MLVGQKIKEYGVLGFIKRIPSYGLSLLSRLLFICFSLLPLKNNWIGFESRGDLTDNAYALFEYMWKHGYDNQYHAIWYVTDQAQSRKKLDKLGFNNVSISSNKLDERFNLKKIYYLARSKYFIYDHDFLPASFNKRKGNVWVCLCHGPGYKANKGRYLPIKTFNKIDFLLSPGKLSTYLTVLFNHCSQEKVVELGFPRYDYYYSDLTNVKNKLNETYNLSNYRKAIIWMPTFRKSNILELNDEINSETGLPLIRTLQELREFNSFLSNLNVLVILKLHPLQAKMEIFDQKFSNIIILNNEKIERMGFQLFQIIPLADAMITDYSGASVDFLPLNRPLIFTLDDIEEYKKNRGIIPENAIELMKGYHVFKVEELFTAICEISEGIDKYKKEREEIIPQYHKYLDGNASRRVVEYLKL